MAATISSAQSLRYLIRRLAVDSPGEDLSAAVRLYRENPLPEDLALVEIANTLGLSDVELAAVGASVLAEEDPLFGAELARLQGPPSGRTRPLAGFLALRAIGGGDGIAAAVHELGTGPAVTHGLIDLLPESAPLPDRAVTIPSYILHALNGILRAPAGVTIQQRLVPLPDSIHRQAFRYADSLRHEHLPCVAIRAAGIEEARSVSRAIAELLRLRASWVEGSSPRGLGTWLRLTRSLPVHVLELAPGEHRNIETPGGYAGPQLIVSGPEGTVTLDSAPVIEWNLPVPKPGERAALWKHALDDESLAVALAPHRHSASRIHGLATLMSQSAGAARRPMTVEDFHQAAWTVERHALGHLALPLEDEVTDEALILPPDLQETLQLLLARCKFRDGLTHGLGASARTRYRSGVRALFSGAPGTGKTLAAGWLAEKLKMPLFRIDLAGVSSKYIGDTEKNLARLLGQAEQSEVILLFDEADSLFGKRTGIQDAHDRYANAQTSYLLQRIESFDGIAILTSNDYSLFDPAFTRRLDFVLEFAAPSPTERRRLWVAHLGEQHELTPPQINRLASSLELAGGDIRNAVFHAAVLARNRGARIGWEDVVTGVRLEFRKLRLSLPADLISATW